LLLKSACSLLKSACLLTDLNDSQKARGRRRRAAAARLLSIDLRGNVERRYVDVEAEQDEDGDPDPDPDSDAEMEMLSHIFDSRLHYGAPLDDSAVQKVHKDLRCGFLK